MKFENVSIKNLESAEKYVEKLMQSEKIFQKEYVEEHIFIGLQRSGQEEIEKQNTEFDGIEKYLYFRINTEGDAFITAKVNQSYWEKAEVSVQEAWSLAEKNINKESFVMGNSEGDEILHGLSNEELKHLKKNLAVIGVERDEKTTAVYMMLCNVEYL